MEYYISGCTECPFYYDDTDGQERTRCHHMSAPTQMGIWVDGQFTPLSFEGPEGLYQLQTENGTYSLSFSRESLPIQTVEINEVTEPITPTWCPLREEHTSIHLKQPTV